MNAALQAFLGHIRGLPELISPLFAAVEPRARYAISTSDIYRIRHIVLTGSGDSYIAAQAAAPALRAWTGLPVQAMAAMEASRYLTLGIKPHPDRLRSTLMVCVSHSGEAARVVEAAQRTRAAGARTLAVTANADSRLGRTVSSVLDIGVSAGSVPGTSSYCASLLGIFLLGIRIAEVRLCISMDAANALRDALTRLPPLMAQSIDTCERAMGPLTQGWGNYHAADILGSGPGAGAAAYGAAKLIEAAGIHAVGQDIEEFFHLNYFVDDALNTPLVLFAPARSAAASRALELCDAVQTLGRPFLLLTDDCQFGPSERSIALPSVAEWLSPVLAVIPATLLAASWADWIGAEYFRGHAGRWSGSRAARLVRGSVIEPGSIEE